MTSKSTQILQFAPYLLFSFLSLVLLGFVLKTNPFLYRALRGLPEPLPAFFPRALIQGTAPLEELSAIHFMYREAPGRSGVHDTSVVSYPLREVWRTQNINEGIHGASKSSPAVDETGVYVGSDAGWFYHFDLDGRLLWRFKVADAVRGIHATALLDQAYVYFGAYNGRFYCLRKTDGHLAWVTQLIDAVGSSALASQEALYVPSEQGGKLDGYLFKLDRRTGKTLWYTEHFGEQVHSSPAIDEREERVFVGANNGLLFAFDTRNGKTLWKANVGGAVKGTPFVKGDRVYVTTWAARLVAMSAKSGQVIWSIALDSKSQSSPTYVPDREMLVFGSSGDQSVLYGVSLTDHELKWKRKWQQPEKDAAATGQIIGSGVSVRATMTGRYYVWIACGRRRLCAIEPETGRILSENDLPGSLTGVPAVFRENLYLSLNEGPLLKLGPTKQAR